MHLCVDAVFLYNFHFPIWCTDPPKIVDFQPEYMVGVRQSATLNCEAEGNPPPTHTWTPCNDPEQVCNKNTLDISQVLNDANLIPAEWPMYMEMIQKLPVFVSHMFIVVMHLTAVTSYMYQHDILIGFSELNQGLACDRL